MLEPNTFDDTIAKASKGNCRPRNLVDFSNFCSLLTWEKLGNPNINFKFCLIVGLPLKLD